MNCSTDVRTVQYVHVLQNDGTDVCTVRYNLCPYWSSIFNVRTVQCVHVTYTKSTGHTIINSKKNKEDQRNCFDFLGCVWVSTTVYLLHQVHLCAKLK